MTRNDLLLTRLKEIGHGPGDLDTRVQAAKAAIQNERLRFTASDAGRIQWNWYVGQLAADIWFESDRIAMAARKRTKSTEPSTGPILDLFGRLQPCILALKDSAAEPMRLARRS